MDLLPVLPDLLPVLPDPRLPKAIICDLDGTLAHAVERDVYEFERCDEDRCDFDIRQILILFSTHERYRIIYITAREARYRPQTVKFLREWGCPAGPLYMRATADHRPGRPDQVVKAELFDRHVRGKYSVQFALEDRARVVAMWRSIGLKCLQVAPGDF